MLKRKLKEYITVYFFAIPDREYMSDVVIQFNFFGPVKRFLKASCCF